MDQSLDEYFGTSAAEEPEEVTEGRPIPKKGNPSFSDKVVQGGKDFMQSQTDIMHLAFDQMSMGLFDDMIGAGNVVKEGLTGGLIREGGFFNNVREAYDEGVQYQNREEALARDRLPLGLELTGDIGGNLTPMGGPSKLNKLLDAGTTVAGGSGILGVAKRLGHEGRKGVVDEMIRQFNEGASSEEMIAYGAVGGAGGIAGQAMLGEMAPAFVKYGLLKMGSDEKVGSLLVDTGPRRDGLSPEEIRKSYPKMIEDGTGLLNTQIGNERASVAGERIAETIARTTFGGRELDRDLPELANEYAETVGFINKAYMDANEAMTNRVVETLGEHTSGYQRYLNQQDKILPAKAFYKSLGQTQRGKLGGKTVKYQKAADRMKERLVASTKSKDFASTPDAYQEAMNLALKTMRPRVEHSHAGTTQTATSGVPDDTGRMLLDTDIDLSTANTSLARLLEARKAVMQAAKPGAVVRGESEKALNTKAASEVAALIDAEIDARIFGQYGKRKSEYAEYMQQQDAHEAGAHFYYNAEDPDYKKNIDEYRAGLSKDAREAFDAGWINQFHEEIRTHGVSAAIQNKVGNVDFREDTVDASKLKTAGWEQMKAIMGEDGAKEFLNEARDLHEFNTAHARIQQNLEQKGYDPTAINDVIRDGDDLLISSGFGPTAQGIMANSTIAAMQRRLASLGPDEQRVLQQTIMAQGGEAAANMERLLRAVEQPSNLPIGNLTAQGAFDSIASPEERQEKDRDTMSEIAAYLGSIN